ncbi:ZIP zinc/iron transporter [Spizellomyces punctatus DAOM BR117]|uniref:ZIP zinc/iron transporter n=1 Tax=Spizellomyces punctatus (strain DAOM BR117) TaxID=645134 RepID=A0A0L0HNK4_SPIPD|nr:ZIP zinc/iron transporter [Spizellomyces punctatus DAOM BR117]KND02623.1 ZIP zinc/iron transporter [Spizellomyces punctatus DAOM BR117]|eukprot:XP_016610662.1 ZIP zinc/iron transporter [Spizellomyces punctatus DAOM BR117]
MADAATPAPSEPIVGDPCALALEGDYDMGLHVASIFIIMGLSLIGTMLPIVSGKCFKSGSNIFQAFKLFGAGVILATALVHMLTPAQKSLANPCLPKAFQDYSAWGSAMALFGILFTHLIQITASNLLRKRKASKAINSTPKKDASSKTLEDGTVVIEEQDPHDVHRLSHAHAEDAHVHSLLLDAEEKTITTYILEAGIASHSIIIGLTLGAAREEFKSLLVALCFHQFFEGLALSTIILDAPHKRLTSILMVLFYSLSTPIGIALGIAIHSSFNENAVASLISMGILDALAAGILLYDGLVNVIVPHFAGNGYKDASNGQQLAQVACLWVGAAVMAVIGRWA